jgi:hypothetical protein
MTKRIKVYSSSLNFTSLLTILFIGLKLMGYITWSWWWVLSPLWLPLAIVIGGYLVVMLVLGLTLITIGAIEHFSKEKI